MKNTTGKNAHIHANELKTINESAYQVYSFKPQRQATLEHKGVLKVEDVKAISYDGTRTNKKTGKAENILPKFANVRLTDAMIEAGYDSAFILGTQKWLRLFFVKPTETVYINAKGESSSTFFEIRAYRGKICVMTRRDMITFIKNVIASIEPVDIETLKKVEVEIDDETVTFEPRNISTTRKPRTKTSAPSIDVRHMTDSELRAMQQELSTEVNA